MINGRKSGPDRKPRRPLDWNVGLSRLGLTAAAGALVSIAAYDLIVMTAGEQVFVPGYILLIGGYLSLGGLFVAVSWIQRGFRGSDKSDGKVTRAPR